MARLEAFMGVNYNQPGVWIVFEPPVYRPQAALIDARPVGASVQARKPGAVQVLFTPQEDFEPGLHAPGGIFQRQVEYVPRLLYQYLAEGPPAACSGDAETIDQP